MKLYDTLEVLKTENDEWSKEFNHIIRLRKKAKNYEKQTNYIDSINTYQESISYGEKSDRLDFVGDVQFSQISRSTIEDFEGFLKTKKENRLTTVEKKLKVFKSYLNRAIDKNLMTENPFKKMVIKKAHFGFDYLEDWELKKFIQYYFSPSIAENHKKALRLFLFSCSTGLRISDAKKIEYSDIIHETIILHPQKTRNLNNVKVKIPLTEFAKGLIKDSRKFGMRGEIFISYADQSTNYFFKEIAKIIGVNKNIKFNMGRHTFATLYLQRNKDIASLKDLLSHSNIMQTKVYAHVTHKTRKEGMKNLNEYFEV